MSESRLRHSLPGFDMALEGLREDALLMGNLVSRSFNNAMIGFTRRANDPCAAAIADDEEVDLLEKKVDRAGTEILLRYSPLGFDLRLVLSTIKLSSLLERISDQTVIIARRVRRLNDEPEVAETASLKPLFQSLQRVYVEAVGAFDGNNLGRAGWVQGQVEALGDQARTLSEDYADAVETKFSSARVYVGLMAIAQHLEEVARLCEQIASETIYVAEARDTRHAGNRLEAD